jgi:hypothetical protein
MHFAWKGMHTDRQKEGSARCALCRVWRRCAKATKQLVRIKWRRRTILCLEQKEKIPCCLRYPENAQLRLKGRIAFAIESARQCSSEYQFLSIIFFPTRGKVDLWALGTAAQGVTHHRDSNAWSWVAECEHVSYIIRYPTKQAHHAFFVAWKHGCWWNTSQPWIWEAYVRNWVEQANKIIISIREDERHGNIKSNNSNRELWHQKTLVGQIVW